MRIWHQSFTDLTVMPLYRKTLTEHAAKVMGSDASVMIHGLRPGTYAPGCAPIDAIKHRYVAAALEMQICDAAMVAQNEGYDAVAIGCFFDPALRAARSLVNIPVLGLGETCALVACSLGRKFGLVTLCADQSDDYSDLMHAYGLERRFAGAIALGLQAAPAYQKFVEHPVGRNDDVCALGNHVGARGVKTRFDGLRQLLVGLQRKLVNRGLQSNGARKAPLQTIGMHQVRVII